MSSREALAALRQAEAEAAAELIGATITFLNQADGELVAEGSLTASLQELVVSCEPSLVITHTTNDYHADHRALASAVIQAVGFRTPLLTCDSLMGVGFVPTIYVDTTRWFEKKTEMIMCHQSQDPHRFIEMSRLQNGFRAAQCGRGLDEYAEAFRFDPVYPFSDIRALLPPAPEVRAMKLRSTSSKSV